MASGWRGIYRISGEIRPGAGFKTGDFAEEKLGGGYRRTTLTQATIEVYRFLAKFFYHSTQNRRKMNK